MIPLGKNMANRLITPEEFARGIVEITERHARTLEEKGRAAFMRACYEWLRDALAESRPSSGDSNA